MVHGFNFITGIKRFPRTIIDNIIPISVMFVLWMIPAVLLQMGKDINLLKPLNFITAGRSGIVNPNGLQIAGGIASKSLVLTFLIGTAIPLLKRGNFKDILQVKSVFFSVKELVKKGIKGVGILFIGAGVALLLHGFMSTDFTLENSFVSIIGMIYSMNLSQKLRIPVFQALAPGFLSSFLIAFLAGNTYIAGAILLVVGGILLGVGIFKGKSSQQNFTLMLIIMVLTGNTLIPVLANDKVFNKDNPGVELVMPNTVTAYEPFEIIIRVTNPNVKKQINRIEINTSSVNSQYIKKPAEDKDGKNYNGEDEIKFSIVVNDYISEPRMLQVNIFFLKLFKSASGTPGQGVNLWLSKGITQQTTMAEIKLPPQYNYKQEGNNPFKNSFNYTFTETVDYKKANFVSFGRRFQVQMYNTNGSYYMPNGPEAFDMISYGLSKSPSNSRMTNPKTMEAPKELLETFGASKGAFILYENRETKFKSSPNEILMDLISLNYFFYYLKGNTIFTIWGDVDDGVFEASASELIEFKKKELYDAMASVRLVPITSNAPVYPVEVKEYFFEDTKNSAPISTENTIKAGGEAVKDGAATPFSKGAVAVALLSGIFATAVAGVAAGAMSTDAGEGEKTDERRRDYQLIISKSVGSNIKSDESITLFASVYERIYEEDGTYSEKINVSLSEKIQFSSPDAFVKFSEATMSGHSRAIAFIAESNSQGKRFATECTITCTVSGAGGTHRQNIVFSIMDEPYVAIEQKLFVLANSGRTFEWNYQLKDFVNPVENVSLSCHQSEKPFEISVIKDLNNNKVKVKDLRIKKPFTGFYESYSCEIVAKNKTETAKTVFYVVMCYEGITVDFLGGKQEILAKLKEDDSGEMMQTRVKIRGAAWSEKEGMLDIIGPEGISLRYEDEEGIFNLLEASSVEDSDFHTPDGKAYLLSVAHSLPSMDAVPGKLYVEGNVRERHMSSMVEVTLEPDRLTYEKAFEKEYLACKRIIEVYMAQRFKNKKLLELERAKNTLGLSDLKLFRQNCWGIAQRCIMQERQQYVIDEAWYDEAIVTAELMVYVGDIAFDLALSPIGGPIAGFLAAQVKSSFLEVIEIIIKQPDKSYFEIIWDFVSSRIEQTLGSADGLIEVPKATEQKKLAIWLTCYVIYRIGFHWWFDKDEDEQPIGLTEAVKAGLQDFVGKGFGVLLGDYIGKCGKGRWPEKISVTDADQDLVNQQVSKAAKAGLDVLDKAAAKADDLALKLYKNLMSYFKTINQ